MMQNGMSIDCITTVIEAVSFLLLLLSWIYDNNEEKLSVRVLLMINDCGDTVGVELVAFA